MARKYSTHEYFELPETNRAAELVYGSVREPPAPSYGHQLAVGRLYRLMSAHVEDRHLGQVCLSPMDVVLDEASALVVQPDLLYISNERSAIVKDHVWGAPDLVVEVVSRSSEHRDRTIKVAWYRRYGVRECWLIHPHARRVDVVDCEGDAGVQSCTGEQRVRSPVLPELGITAEDCFR